MVSREELLSALDDAKAIIDFCSGDAYERECTEDARRRFEDVYKRAFPEPPKPEAKFEPMYCEACDRLFISRLAYNGHLLGKKHARKAALTIREGLQK